MMLNAQMGAAAFLRRNPALTRQAALLANSKPFFISQQQRGFRQVKNLHEIVWTAQAELTQRTAKYLERTDKVYKPS